MIRDYIRYKTEIKGGLERKSEDEGKVSLVLKYVKDLYDASTDFISRSKIPFSKSSNETEGLQ